MSLSARPDALSCVLEKKTKPFLPPEAVENAIYKGIVPFLLGFVKKNTKNAALQSLAFLNDIKTNEELIDQLFHKKNLYNFVQNYIIKDIIFSGDREIKEKLFQKLLDAFFEVINMGTCSMEAKDKLTLEEVQIATLEVQKLMEEIIKTKLSNYKMSFILAAFDNVRNALLLIRFNYEKLLADQKILKSMQEESYELSDLVNHIKRLESEMKGLTAENDELSHELSETRQQLKVSLVDQENKQRQLDLSENALLGTKEQLNLSKKELSDVQEKLNLSEKELVGVKELLSLSEKELIGVQEQLNLSRKDLVGTEEKLSQVELNYQEKQKELNVLHDEFEDFRNELWIKLDEKVVLFNELKKKSETIIKNKFNGSMIGVEEQQEKLSELQNELAHIKKESAEQQAAYEAKLAEQAQKAEEVQKNQQVEIASLRNQLDAAIAHLSPVSESPLPLRNEVSSFPVDKYAAGAIAAIGLTTMALFVAGSAVLALCGAALAIPLSIKAVKNYMQNNKVVENANDKASVSSDEEMEDEIDLELEDEYELASIETMKLKPSVNFQSNNSGLINNSVFSPVAVANSQDASLKNDKLNRAESPKI